MGINSKSSFLAFDYKLSFIPHIKMLKGKCLKALDVKIKNRRKH